LFFSWAVFYQYYFVFFFYLFIVILIVTYYYYNYFNYFVIIQIAAVAAAASAAAVAPLPSPPSPPSPPSIPCQGGASHSVLGSCARVHPFRAHTYAVIQVAQGFPLPSERVRSISVAGLIQLLGLLASLPYFAAKVFINPHLLTPFIVSFPRAAPILEAAQVSSAENPESKACVGGRGWGTG
jgi:hypothetical protein